MGNLTHSYATTVASEHDEGKIATINAALQILDSAINGRLTISTTGGTTTLTGTPAAPQAQNLFLDVSGTLASNGIIEIPIAAGTGRNRHYIVRNGTSGAFSLTVRKVGGTGVTVAQGYTAILIYNDSDIVKGPEWVSTTGEIARTSLPAAIWARAYHNANQSISTSTETAVALNSERNDTDSIHDNSTNNSRLTCRTAGVYLITGQLRYAAHATGWRRAGIKIGGTTYIGLRDTPSLGGTDEATASVATIYPLAVNEYVELIAYQNSGSSLNVLSTGSFSPEFMMVRLGS